MSRANKKRRTFNKNPGAGGVKHGILLGATVPIKLWTEGVFVEPEARQQLMDVASMPFVYKNIAVMPDVHVGRGGTVGSVIATQSAIIPATVGVDIGCGMQAVLTSMTASQLPDNLKSIREAIERVVPHGRTNDGGKGDRGAWGAPPGSIRRWWTEYLEPEYKEIIAKHPRVEAQNDINHLGTLGTGNHFIEICLDEQDRVWIMLHSGSRGVGNRIGSYFIDVAKRKMEEWFIELPNRDLAYLPVSTPEFEDYWKALSWAQRYAKKNRDIMMHHILVKLWSVDGLPKFEAPLELVDCHHNYCAIENHFGSNVYITRKGAVRARVGDLGIIPGSMGAKSFIVEGLGNPDSFNSCSHGAGRKMSRTEARKKFTVEDHKRAVKGIECRTDEDVIDETPAAYKDIDAVMNAQSDLVKIKHTLRQVVCVKG